MKEIKRGQIWYCDLSPVVGSEQGGLRPCLVIQNDIGNKYSPTTIIAIITSRNTKAKLPTQHWINKGQGGLVCDSMVECEQIRTIDKSRLKKFMGTIGEKDQEEINNRLNDLIQQEKVKYYEQSYKKFQDENGGTYWQKF